MSSEAKPVPRVTFLHGAGEGRDIVKFKFNSIEAGRTFHITGLRLVLPGRIEGVLNLIIDGRLSAELPLGIFPNVYEFVFRPWQIFLRLCPESLCQCVIAVFEPPPAPIRMRAELFGIETKLETLQ